MRGNTNTPLRLYWRCPVLIGIVLQVASCRGREAAVPAELAFLRGASSRVREQVLAQYAMTQAKPQNAAVQGRMGMILHAYEQFGVAKEFYARAHELQPESYRWMYYLADVASSMGKSEEAGEWLHRVLARRPDYFPAQLRLAELHLGAGESDKSLEAYQKAVQIDPKNAAARYGLGRSFVERGQLPDAVTHLTEATRLFPSYGAAHYQLAVALRKLGHDARSQAAIGRFAQHKQARPEVKDPLLTAVLHLNRDAMPIIRDAMHLQRIGKIPQAIAAYEKALQINPEHAQSHANLVDLYARVKRYDLASGHYAAAARLNPDQPQLNFYQGRMLFKQGKIDEAKQAFERELAINPYHPQAHNHVGYILERKGSPTQAILHYRLALENQPEYKLAQFQLGRLLAEQESTRTEGLRYLIKAGRDANGQSPQFLSQVALAFWKAGDRTRGIEMAGRAKDRAAALGQVEQLSRIEAELQEIPAND